MLSPKYIILLLARGFGQFARLADEHRVIPNRDEPHAGSIENECEHQAERKPQEL